MFLKEKIMWYLWRMLYFSPTVPFGSEDRERNTFGEKLLENHSIIMIVLGYGGSFFLCTS